MLARQSSFLLKTNIPFLFRNHFGPDSRKTGYFTRAAWFAGSEFGGGDNPTPKDYAALAEQFKNRPDAELLQVMILRASMQQAVYEPHCDGHFGLAYGAYAHFTSPIRRYPI